MFEAPGEVADGVEQGADVGDGASEEGYLGEDGLLLGDDFAADAACDFVAGVEDLGAWAVGVGDAAVDLVDFDAAAQVHGKPSCGVVAEDVGHGCVEVGGVGCLGVDCVGQGEDGQAGGYGAEGGDDCGG